VSHSREYDRAYYLKNREKILARKRKWHNELSPEKKKLIGRRNTMRLYGATLVDYEIMLKEQNGQCAICGVSPFGQALDVDHCHETGAIRGLLCGTCNAGIGLLKDNPDLCYKASMYLAPKAAKAA
jgi:hypothetical protein